MNDADKYGGLSFSILQLMGFGRARAIAEGMRLKEGQRLPNDQVVHDDFRCDAEEVSIDNKGVLRKS